MAEKNTKPTEKKRCCQKNSLQLKTSITQISADDKTNHCADNVTQATNSKKKEENAQWIMPINPLKLTTAFQRKNS